MCKAKTGVLIISCITTLTLFLGCAVPVYRPVSRPDMTYAAAVEDLQNVARSGTIDWLPGWGRRNHLISNITVNENGTVRWEFRPEPGHPPVDMTLSTLEPHLAVYETGWWGKWTHKIDLPDFMIIGGLPALERVVDDLHYIIMHLEELPKLKHLAEKQNKELALFEPVAAKYRALAIKPPVSEDQRRLIVQANALTQQKRFDKAIEQYKKVIEFDSTSYPAAYFNLALLLAQENAPVSAVFYMKHYLLLVPDAPDARSAQDKIYEWEMMTQK